MSSVLSQSSQNQQRRTAARGRFVLFMGLLGVAFIFLTFGYVAWEQRANIMQRNEEEIRRNAFFLADHAGRLFEVANLAIQQTTDQTDNLSWDVLETSRPVWVQVRAIKDALPYIDDIWLTDSTGKVRLTSRALPTPNVSIADRDAFMSQMEADQGLFIGAPIIGRLSGRPTFMISRRLQNPDGTFRGTVSVTVAQSYFNSYWSEIRLPKLGRVTLVRGSDGAILTQYPPPPDGVTYIRPDNATLNAALSVNPDFGAYIYQSETERMGAYHRVGDLPLYIRVSLPTGAYWEPWAAQIKLYGSFALIALMALIALTTLAAQQFREQRENAAVLEAEVALRTKELQAETAALEVLNRTGTSLAADLDLERIVQSVVDAGVELTGAKFGAFFYHSEAASDTDASERPLTLYSLSGAAREAFANYPVVRPTKIFAPTFIDQQAVRSNDILADPRYGQNAPFQGMPDDHLPVRSYLAVPVVSRNGDVQGALLFGHPEPNIFTERAERLVKGLAGHTSITLDNVHLYQAAQREIDERKQAQQQQSLLIRELHHRVKNTLATVQAVVGATARSTSSIDEFYEAFVGRIISLANTHSLLTEALWQTASLRELLEKELSPYYDETGIRILLDGPDVELPSEAAVPIGMAIHELTTNAAKYGALCVPTGRIHVRWSSSSEEDGTRLKLEWAESGGPAVTQPTRQGFGSRLLHRVLASQLNAEVTTDFAPEGLQASIDAFLKPTTLLNPKA